MAAYFKYYPSDRTESLWKEMKQVKLSDSLIVDQQVKTFYISKKIMRNLDKDAASAYDSQTRHLDPRCEYRDDIDIRSEDESTMKVPLRDDHKPAPKETVPSPDIYKRFDTRLRIIQEEGKQRRQQIAKRVLGAHEPAPKISITTSHVHERLYARSQVIQKEGKKRRQQITKRLLVKNKPPNFKSISEANASTLYDRLYLDADNRKQRLERKVKDANLVENEPISDGKDDLLTKFYEERMMKIVSHFK